MYLCYHINPYNTESITEYSPRPKQQSHPQTLSSNYVTSLKLRQWLKPALFISQWEGAVLAILYDGTFYSYFIYLFIYFLAVLGLQFVRGLSPVTASGGHSSSRCGDRSSSRCAGLSPSRPLPLQGTGSRRAGSVAVAHGPSRSAACGIFPDQGSNPCPLH